MTILLHNKPYLVKVTTIKIVKRKHLPIQAFEQLYSLVVALYFRMALFSLKKYKVRRENLATFIPFIPLIQKCLNIVVSTRTFKF